MSAAITFKTLMFAWLVVILGSSFPSTMEGYLAPVIQNVKFTTTTEDNISTITMRYEELRKCTLKNIYWYIGSDFNTKVRISTIIQEADVVKYADGTRYITWTMNAAMSDKSVTRTIYVEHICHPFWSSLTKIR